MDDDAVAMLTRQMSRGDRAAVERFYRAWFDDLLSLARRAVGPGLSRDESLCLDVVHDAVLRVVRCVRPIDPPDAARRLRAWLRLVVQSCALDRLRRERRRAARERAAAPHEASPAVESAAIDEQACWLRTQIDRLDPRLARIIELRYDRGWTLAQIAAAVGGSAGSVDGRLRRAIALLRDRAAGHFGDGGDGRGMNDGSQRT